VAKITSTKKLVIEDYPAEVKPWIKKLIDPLNRFLEQSYYALVNGLTIADNLKGQVSSLDVVASQEYPIAFAWRLNERPTVLLVGNCEESTGGTVAAFSTAWTYNNGQVLVTFTGLDTAKKYTIKLVGLV
jgi:hypothetical protein